MQARERVEVPREDEPEVLQIALTPAPIPLGIVDEGRRDLLVAAAQLRSEPGLPARAAQQPRLDEVVAQDLAAEGLLARKAG